jgi:hypothetical protein
MFTNNHSRVDRCAARERHAVYVVLMVLGHRRDLVRHRSQEAPNIFRWRKSRSKATGRGWGRHGVLALKTGVMDVLASGEFCSAHRRIATC